MISFDFLVTTAILLGVLLIFSSYYSQISELSVRIFSKSRVEFVKGVLYDALDGCSPSEIRITFPYSVSVDCSSSTASVGGVNFSIPACHGGGTGRVFIVRACSITVKE